MKLTVQSNQTKYPAKKEDYTSQKRGKKKN